MGSVWTLLAFGLVGMLATSVLVGLAVGAILGQISREITGLLHSEPWPSGSNVTTVSLRDAAAMSSRGTRSMPAA